ncbi:MAG TPA: HAD-IC family P-type ATPase, partial [Pseudonocardiaceae bacterium]|nr:HAD-IC family P-type ATPase [Pseudonocardiaceae bacterium]
MVRTAVDVAGEAAIVGVSVASVGARASTEAARSVTGVVRRVVAVGAQHWQEGQRFHLPLRVPDARTGREAQQVIKKVVAGVLEHPDVLVAYWDGGLGRLVVQVAENAVTDRVVEAATSLAVKHGLASTAEEAEEVPHPGDVGEVRAAAVALALDAAGLAGALTARMVGLRRPPQTVTAALTLLREDPRLRSVLRSQLGNTTADLVLAVANAAVYSVDQSPTELVLDAALRAAQLAEAVARVAAFDAAHDQLCVPERTSSTSTAPVRRPAPVDPVGDYAVRAVTGSVLGAAATLLFKRNLQEASAAVTAGSPKPARYGWAAYQAGLGCALAWEGVLVRDGERLRLLQVVDTVVVHSSALRGTGRTVADANSNVAHWSQDRLWRAAEGALRATIPSETELRLRPVPDGHETGTGLMIASVQGQDVGTVLVSHEPDPLAGAVLDAARRAGLRVVVVGDSAVGDHVGLADEIIGSDRGMSQIVSALQDDGHVVLTIARLDTERQDVGGFFAVTDPDVVAGLLRADLAVTLADEGSAVLWAADLVCARGLVGVWRLLQAVPAARKAGQHAMTYGQASAALSGLLVITGGQRRWANLLSPLPSISPVNLAAAAALLSGWGFALGVATITAPTPRPQILWHALTPDEVLRRLTNDSKQVPDPRPGPAEQRRRLVRTVSRLPGAAPIRLSLRLADAVRVELNDPLTPILAVGAGASAILGSTVDALLVLGAMAVNAVVGGVQRLRAESALASLTATQKQKARRVLTASNESEGRNGTEVIDAAQLAQGDVIELGVGDVVPADARVLELSGLEVDESALTGESLPVAKQVAAASPRASIADRRCIVFEGTTVVAGQARAVVVNTGEHTETGRAVTLASRTPPAAGVQARLRELTSKALPLTLAGGAAVTGLSLLRGRPIRQAIGGGVAVAVAAVPEGLPLVATVAQMAAARRLSRRGVLVRTARTLEALGRVDTVCFDKTGTLTQNRLRVVRVATVDGIVHPPTEPEARAVLQTAACACPQDEHESGKHSHATDEAVLAAAPPDPDWAQVSGQPFETNRGYAAAIGTSGNTTLLAVKGAPEVILPCCPAVEPALVAVAENLAGDGLRVLAVAQRRIEPSQAPQTVDEPLGDLELVGFLALADSPRPSSAPLVTGLRDSGVSPVMLTGDHPQTALAIAITL